MKTFKWKDNLTK